MRNRHLRANENLGPKKMRKRYIKGLYITSNPNPRYGTDGVERCRVTVDKVAGSTHVDTMSGGWSYPTGRPDLAPTFLRALAVAAEEYLRTGYAFIFWRLAPHRVDGRFV